MVFSATFNNICFTISLKPGWLNELGSWIIGLPCNSYKPITNTAWVRARLCILQKGRTRLAAASDNDYQLLAHGRFINSKSILLMTLSSFQ
jgi:hypothetical protein